MRNKKILQKAAKKSLSWLLIFVSFTNFTNRFLYIIRVLTFNENIRKYFSNNNLTKKTVFRININTVFWGYLFMKFLIRSVLFLSDVQAAPHSRLRHLRRFHQICRNTRDLIWICLFFSYLWKSPKAVLSCCLHPAL